MKRVPAKTAAVVAVAVVALADLAAINRPPLGAIV